MKEEHFKLCLSSLNLSQVRMMEEVGFTEVDIAWRQDGFFVAGGGDPWPSWQSLNRIRIIGVSQICIVTKKYCKNRECIAVPNGCPNPTRYQNFFDARPVPFRFEHSRVTGDLVKPA